MRNVSSGRPARALHIEKILDVSGVCVGPIIRTDVSAFCRQPFAPGVMRTAGEMARIALAQRCLPGVVDALLRVIGVVSRREKWIRPQTGDTIKFNAKIVVNFRLVKVSKDTIAPVKTIAVGRLVELAWSVAVATVVVPV